MFSTLQLPRVSLRLLNHKDGHSLWSILSDRRVGEFNDYDLPLSRSDVKQMIQDDISGFYEQKVVRLAIIESTTNAFIGSVGIYDINGDSAWLGFELAPHYWQCGYMLEILELLITKRMLETGFPAFTHQIQTFQANVSPHNIACIKLLSKLGFELKENTVWMRTII
ncbi:hypothetical protein AMS58_08515 [Pseudoalteromonas porphyrae]|uniref:GNAT family N-acetyltransferase n=1 Tax=Pseudoalteromonas neustonica TaxID=1840331 RepID=UPI0006BB2E9B|nr:GNAT family N-acetyltransferase [Pseudoalteromonas neustonica]KPH94955.1 hypothetical protein AMS58_08515 [Pseudoalteromonas porphyrae]